MVGKQRLRYLIQYDSEEDQIKELEVDGELVYDRRFWFLPEGVRTVHCLNVPSTGKPVYSYHFLYWELLEPCLKGKEAKYQILGRLPKGAGRSSH